MAAAVPWDRFDLIIFDMDGTLYDQSHLRRRMLAMLLAEMARSRSMAVPRLLRAFRRQRERLADAMEADFVRLQYVLPGHEPHRVRAIVTEWMEERPLPLLRAFRAAGVAELFARLSESHVLAVHSDYRAERKLAALGLAAQLTVAAEDVGRLKPDPAGLHRLMAQAKAEPARTLMIGDRDERDGEAARRAGVRSLIRGRDFRDFTDAIFG
jgi:HAD superfamily hydrolase (TIGR01549 family)